MKGSIFLLFLLICSPGFSQTKDQPAKKCYCTAEQIELTNSTILIHFNDKIFEIDTLAVDQGGIYFTEDMLRCTYCRRPLNPKNTCECTISES